MAKIVFSGLAVLYAVAIASALLMLADDRAAPAGPAWQAAPVSAPSGPAAVERVTLRFEPARHAEDRG